MQKWGLTLAHRRGRNRAIVALARKLAVAAWHVLMGHDIRSDDHGQRLETKIFKLATDLGVSAIKDLGFQSKEDFVQKKVYILRSYS